jgi:signal transduction histidine kinase
MEPATDRRLRWLAAGVSAGVLVASVAYGNAAGAPPEAIARVLLVAGSFLITGFFAWMRRPANRMGRLMIALGNCLLLIVFATPVWPAIVPLGLIGFTLAGTLLGYLILAYPSGELRSTADRILVILTAILVGGPRFIRMLADDPAARGAGYENPYLLIHDPSVADAMRTIPYLLDIVVLTAFVAFVTARWAHASGPTRRTLTPVLLPTLVLLLILLADAVIVVADVPVALKEFSDSAQLLARAVIPVGFLYGLLRTQMARSAVVDLVVELGATPTPARLRDALANALGDPTLSVGYWSSEANAFLDAEGESMALPVDDPTRAVTVLERDGTDLAAIIHDPALLEDPGLVASVATALRLAVENERLQAQVETQLDEVRASRARIVEAGDAERKRVERDLHDGAQQRLVSLTLALRLAQTKLGDDADPSVRLALEQASSDAKAALAELRELARGIYPTILTEAGLGPAIETLADRSPVAVTVDVGAERFTPAIEGAAYFVVSEALANIAKYADAEHANVRTLRDGDSLIVEITDDGVGGADPGSGSGLRGLADRLAAIDGTLEVTSPSGGGTCLRAHIPTNAPAAMPG